MRLHAREAPITSAMGGGLMLLDDQKHPRFQLMLAGARDPITIEQTAELIRQIRALVNEFGLILPGE